MKFFCVILSIYIFSLLTAPCCSEGNCLEDPKLVQTDQDNHQDDDCNTCPPFFSCGTCSGFVYTLSEFRLNVIASHRVEFTDSYKSPFAEGVIARIWEPPKAFLHS